MMFTKGHLALIENGTKTQTRRAWVKPRVKVGKSRSRGNRGKTPLIREMDRFIETNLRAAASELGRDVTTLRVLLWEESERPAKGGK